MKTYVISRNDDGRLLVRVLAEGVTPSYPLRHIVRHSPTGFEIGYGGPGPADLALSILTDCVPLEVAEAAYQGFKWAYLGLRLAPGESCAPLPEAEIRDWLMKEGYGLASPQTCIPAMDFHFTAAQRAYLEDRVLNPLTVISAMLQKWLAAGERLGATNPDVHRAMAAVDKITERIRALDRPGREETGA